MLEGNKFFPLLGIPILNKDLNKTKFEVWLPEPLGVATCMEKSLTIFIFYSTPILSFLFTVRLPNKMCSPVGYYQTSACINVHNTIASDFKHL